MCIGHRSKKTSTNFSFRSSRFRKPNSTMISATGRLSRVARSAASVHLRSLWVWEGEGRVDAAVGTFSEVRKESELSYCIYKLHMCIEMKFCILYIIYILYVNIMYILYNSETIYLIPVITQVLINQLLTSNLQVLFQGIQQDIQRDILFFQRKKSPTSIPSCTQWCI